MATESSGDNFADVSISSQLELLNQIDNPHIQQNVAATPNGSELDKKPVAHIEDQQAFADVHLSGGSDGETSRADWPRQRDSDKGHGQSASVAKKPATFKAVSVNKTFLASKASPTGNITKSADKPTPGSSTPPPGSSLSSSRPRLVAKTGGGAKDTVPRLSSSVNGSKPASAPDPAAVWNKNRPPEPKKFTDEELKKYGIHMASRLNVEDAQGQNKWADIDEDDEDWAPETITWGDGTKTTLPHLDEHSVPSQESSALFDSVKGPVKPKSPVPSITSRSSVPRSGGLGTGRGLVLKQASQEKPALISKTTASVAPAKSPWATLPPIDRASPGFVETTQPAAALPRDTTTAKLPNQKRKEIAADDFSRSSWREGLTHSNKELYNSHSGRYEPVVDRRGSFRSESQTKHPALLQRPQPKDQDVETETFQQASRNPQENLFPRRRGSSSVSIGSGSFHQRMPRSNDLAGPSTQMGSVGMTSQANLAESPVSSEDGPSSNSSQPKELSSQRQLTSVSPNTTISKPSQGGSSFDTCSHPPQHQNGELVDELEYQKKVMRERIELARKRRQEEEAQEEAARKERIQKKLEALGPPPEKKSDKKELSTRAEVTKPSQIRQRDRHVPIDAISQKAEQEPTNEEQKAVSSVTNQPGGAQIHTKPHSSISTLPSVSTPFRRLSQGQESRRADPWGGTGPRPEKFTWASALPPPSRNVWGSPDNDRGLGNGTFNPDLGRVTNNTASSAQSSKGPLPIGPPSTSTRAPSQSQPQASQNPSVNAQSSVYGPPGSELASKWVASVAENDKKLSTARLADRVSHERHMMERGMAIEDSQPAIKDSWRPMHAPGDGTRHSVGTVDVQTHASAPWKAAKEGMPKSPRTIEDSTPSSTAGIIGSGAPPQSRPSRFFPAKDIRQGVGFRSIHSRPNSPTPPPPTMEGHPVYEGDIMHPNVSLPKPQPVVKLPPAMTSMHLHQTRPQNVWTTRAATKSSHRDNFDQGWNSDGQGNWQARFNKLLHGDKLPQSRDVGVDASSKGPLDHASHQAAATVSLPTPASTKVDTNDQSLISKPMAEECFEEQEMGSLPQIRLPHRTPEAAWQPAVAPAKSLPKRFLVQAALMEPFQFASDIHGRSCVINILLPGMKEVRTVSSNHSIPRGSRDSHGQRGALRHKPFASGPRTTKREGSGSHESESTPGRVGRGGRGGYRSSRGSDHGTRHHSSQSQKSAK
ncbi:uncharacterized protein UV8b_00182 [Ustilaginoidea virens]|uniref:Uncharacterized protein n=1 Tax=Ustilaginoidea virens TaxID=1159556 RepID=A0A8E5HIA7_USTVR|nr:uncharacterized protein UV8b_00182 [Ustilaginoidea virens]QUC15941.1 hypothetical protein UV8b_00182 [Ustilaginoidea virens]